MEYNYIEDFNKNMEMEKIKKYRSLHLKEYISVFHGLLLYEWVEKISASNDLLEELEVMYEWEYKFNKILQSKNIRNEKRINNMILALRKNLIPILNNISEKLVEVFEDWLEKHAITKLEIWAKERVKDIEEIGYDFEDEEAFEVMFGEYKRYSGGSKKDFQKDFLDSSLEYIDEIAVEEFIRDEILNIEEEIEEEDDEDYKEDLEQRKSELEEYENDAAGYIKNYLGVSEAFEMFGPSIFYSEESFVNAYKKLIFPKWYSYWKSKGIDKTRKTVEKVYKDLKKSIREKDLKKKIAYINIALNTSHQTGSMMDYVEQEYGVDKRDLDNLTKSGDKFAKKWDKEVQKIVR